MRDERTRDLEQVQETMIKLPEKDFQGPLGTRPIVRARPLGGARRRAFRTLPLHSSSRNEATIAVEREAGPVAVAPRSVS